MLNLEEFASLELMLIGKEPCLLTSALALGGLSKK
jgi:hypothetical protein